MSFVMLISEAAEKSFLTRSQPQHLLPVHVALPAQGKCVTAPTNLVWGSERRKHLIQDGK